MKRLCTNAHSLNIYEAVEGAPQFTQDSTLHVEWYLTSMKDIPASLIESVAYKQNKELRLFGGEREQSIMQEQKWN